MTDLLSINKQRKIIKYGIIVFFVNAIASVANPWWPQVFGVDLHLLIALGTLLFILYFGSKLSNSACGNCGEKIFPLWARVTGLAIFQRPLSCSHCGQTLNKEV